MKDKKRIRFRYRVSIIISIAIIIMTILGLIKINKPNNDYKYMAEKGVLDITRWDMKDIVYLDGEWEFYPNILLEPNDIRPGQLSKYKENMKYVRVPGEWNSYLNDDNSPAGGGTYRLIIRVPENTSYGIKTRTIRSSNKIYFNGEEIINVGKPALKTEDFGPGSKYKVGGGGASNNEIELLIQVANYNYNSGGILKPIQFGTLKSIIELDDKDHALDMLVVSIFLVLGIYFLASFLQRKKEIYLLYFSIINFTMGLYQSSLNEQVLDLLFDYNFATRTRIQVISMVLISFCILQFIYNLFKEYCNKKIIIAISIVNIALLLILFMGVDKIIIFELGILTSIILTISMMLSYIYVIYILFKTIVNNEDSLEYISIIATSLTLYWGVIILKIFTEINIERVQTILTILMLGGTAGLINHRLQLDYKRTNQLAKKLIQQDELKDQFLVSASHQLRTPLQVILNLTKNLLEGQKGTLNLKQQESLLFIHQEGKRLLRLVWDLLDASQIQKGGIILKPDIVKPHPIIEKILREMRLLIPKNKSLILKNQIDKDFPALYADTDKFRQIIYNLVYNAIKYTSDGEILVSGEVVCEHAKIIISDTGIGIKEKHHKEIFDTFYKVDYEKDMEQGLGLGLSISKYLIEVQGGSINVKSTYNKGSSFIFTLPLYCKHSKEISLGHLDPQTNVEIKQGHKDTSRQNKPTILIVDNDIENQQTLKSILDELKIHSVIVNNGAEALDIIRKNIIDLVILDFILPDISGDEICKKIRSEYSMVELPIIILTASGKIANAINIAEYGINDFHRKPIHLIQLKSKIQSLLQMKKTAEEDLVKEFQYFQSQISPHFLYNTINTIIGLSYKDSEKTRKALNNLSIYFRAKLDIYKENSLIPLEAELDLIMAYLEIEELRFGERLTVEYNIEEDLGAMIPPLTLQPIVENSVRHGIVPMGENGLIKIVVKAYDSDFIEITIEDNGMGMSEEKREELLNGSTQRIGFTNVIGKIQMIKNASLKLESSLGKGTRVTILIPKSKHSGNNSLNIFPSGA